MAYSIQLDYLEHSGGTKFYETILMRDESSGASMLVKRFGPIGSKVGSGQFALERGTYEVNQASRMKILNEKTRTSKGYDRAPSPSASPTMRKANNATIVEDIATFAHAVNKHYPSKEAKAILAHFGLTIDFGAEDVVELEPQPHEPEARGEPSWGSW